MAAPTRAVLRGIIDSILTDSEVTDAEENDAINEAILAVRGDLVVAATASSPVSALQVAVPTGFVYVHRVEIDDEPIPQDAWYIRDGSAPKIAFNKALFGGVAPVGTLTISGYKVQEILAADGDVLSIDPGYIQARALASLHSSRGGTASDLTQWHQSEHTKWANIAEQRYPEARRIYGAPADARIVRGVLGV